MILIPKKTYAQYMNLLKASNVSADLFQEYVKWLRYFLDFCDRHVITPDKAERLRLFQEKLREKKQSEGKCRAAFQSVSLYFKMQEGQIADSRVYEGSNDTNKPEPPLQIIAESTNHTVSSPRLQRRSQYSESAYHEKSDSPDWDTVMESMANEIKVRHYSRKTLKTYANWSRQFQRFLNNKPPQELSGDDVKAYLTHLAVTCKVASTTQNQAFNSLLFFYRHGLKREFAELKDVPRAKKSSYVPMVLSRVEIDAILAQLSYPFDLVVKLLFGCGLRQFECLQLRVSAFIGG